MRLTQMVWLGWSRLLPGIRVSSPRQENHAQRRGRLIPGEHLRRFSHGNVQRSLLMKTNLTLLVVRLGLLALLLSILIPQFSTCFAQGTAFTYQGRLNDGASPANGSY